MTKDNSNQRLTIRSNWDLGMMENVIRQAIPNCRIWGDLNITRQEAESMLGRIRLQLKSQPSYARLIKFVRDYPAVFITEMTNFILFEYDNINFWDSWADRMELTLNASQQGEIGRTLRVTLNKFGMKIIHDEGYINVSTLLYQAGIPGISYHKIFDILDSTLNIPYIQAQDIIEEMTGYRNFLVDVSVRRYFEDHPDGVQEIQSLRDMMRELGDIAAYAELPDVAEVPERVVEMYRNWCIGMGQADSKHRRNSQYFVAPKLAHDETKGLCLFIPEQLLRNDSVYRLRWVIKGVGPEFSKTVCSDVLNTGNENWTQSLMIPIPPAVEYDITLYDDDVDEQPMTGTWNLHGLSDDRSVLSFDSMGFLVDPGRLKLSGQGFTLVFDGEKVRISTSESIVRDDLYLQREWDEYSAFRFVALDHKAFMQLNRPEGSLVFESHRMVDFELSTAGTLFNELYPVSSIPVYTRFPDLKMSGIDPESKQSLSKWQIVLINRTSKVKVAKSLEEFLLESDEGVQTLDLHEWSEQKFPELTGFYEIRLYQGASNRRQTSFYIVPPVKYLDQVEQLLSDRQTFKQDAYLRVPEEHFKTMVLDQPVQIMNLRWEGDNWVEIRPSWKGAYITGHLKISETLHVPFRKTFRTMEWMLWNDQSDETDLPGSSKSFFLQNFQDAIWRLKVHFSDPRPQFDEFRIQLEGSDGTVLQWSDLSIDRKGNSHVTLNQFQDTMSQNPLPQRLVLHMAQGFEDFEPIEIASLVNFVQLKNPKYKFKFDPPIIVWDADPNNNFKDHDLKLTPLHDFTEPTIQEPLTEILHLKDSKGRKLQGIRRTLKEGIYHIDAVPSNETSFFDEEDAQFVRYQKEHVLVANGAGFLTNMERQSKDAGLWLAAAAVAQSRSDWMETLVERFTQESVNGNWHFDPEHSSLQLFSLVLSCKVQSDLEVAAKESLYRFIQIMNERVILNTQRTGLLKKLLESSIEGEEVRFLIRELQLYLFAPDGETIFERPLLQRMWSIEPRMAILINLRDCSENVLADIDRVMGRIGTEALSKFLVFKSSPNCDSRNYSDCFECLIANHGGCAQSVFRHSSNVWGDLQEYNRLFCLIRNDAFVREPKPEDTTGYEILGKSYLKLYYDAVQKNGHYFTQNAQEISKTFEAIDHLASKYHELLHPVEKVLRARTEGPDDLYFFQSGRAAILQALNTNKKISVHEIKSLLPFWRHSKTATPDLVYRDLVLAELYAMTLRRNTQWQ